MPSSTDSFVRKLAADYRVIMLGGLAVIAHGFSRSTFDADIWLDPMSSSNEWCDALEKMQRDFPAVSWQRISDHSIIQSKDLAKTVEQEHLIRAIGLDYPLDIFRIPNEFEAEDFTSVWQRGTRRADGLCLPDPLDLIQSKLDTGRDKDMLDILHLESVIKKDYSERIPHASFQEAKEMLERYFDSTVLLEAYKNPSLQVKELALKYLTELAQEGDPFSQKALQSLE